MSIRCLLSLTAVHGWNLTQMDVANAFLQRDLDEVIYMQLPQGYHVQGAHKVFKLRKFLYGLK